MLGYISTRSISGEECSIVHNQESRDPLGNARYPFDTAGNIATQQTQQTQMIQMTQTRLERHQARPSWLHRCFDGPERLTDPGDVPVACSTLPPSSHRRTRLR